jgi:hypothetical protein
MALTVRERCEKRLTGLKAARAPYEPEWKEVAQHCQPSRGRFLSGDSSRSFKRSNRAIYNSHGILAFRTLTGGMTSGLSSPSRPWFRLAPFDQGMEDAEARIWLSEVERRMYAFLAATNFYAAVKSGYSELGMFGTEGCVMVDHWREGAVCHPLTVGEYWIALGDDAKPDTLYRDVPATVVQAVQMFGLNNVSTKIRDLYSRSDYDKPVSIIHAIEPNQEQDDSVQTYRGKPWRSFYWDTEDGDKANGSLRHSGMEEQPFWAPRWDAIGGEVYGSSPGMDALPDLRELQLQTKRKTEATAFMVKPEKIVPPNIKLTGQAGNVVSASSVDKDSILIPYQIPIGAIPEILNDMQRCTQSVDRLAYADLFMAITNMDGIQPRNVEEIAARNEEKMTQLGPVIERVNNEKLEVAIDRTFGIMSRKGMLPEAPESLQGKHIKIDFVSILTQMQRMVGLGQTERVVSFIGGLSGAYPAAADKLNVDQTIDDYADRAGAPPKIIRSDEEVEQIRDGREQQQKRQQAIESMPAVKDGADAAKLLADANQQGGISQLLGMAA